MHFDKPSIPRGFTPPVYQASCRDFGGGVIEVSASIIKRRPSELGLIAQDFAERGEGPLWPSKSRPPRGEKGEPSAADVERSCRRARQSVRWRVKGQGLDHLLTLTVRENMTDEAEFKKAWYRFHRLLRASQAGAPWPYVATLERQQRGAFHLHVACKGRQDVNKLRGLWWKALGARVSWHRGRPEALGANAPGNVDVQGPRSGRSAWRSRGLAGYLSKYITKGADSVAFGARRYWAPDGWVAPVAERFMLAAQDLRGALLEVAEWVERRVGVWVPPWRSPDWSCIWVGS